MKRKLINFVLIVTSLIGYLEWGSDNQTFLFEAEYEVLVKLFSDPHSVIHPFILLPLFGQLLLLITLFQKTPSRILTYIGIVCIGLLLGFMFFIGLLSLNFKILLSTLPFVVTSIIAIKTYRKK